jgi:hypothetical protein
MSSLTTDSDHYTDSEDDNDGVLDEILEMINDSSDIRSYALIRYNDKMRELSSLGNTINYGEVSSHTRNFVARECIILYKAIEVLDNSYSASTFERISRLTNILDDDLSIESNDYIINPDQCDPFHYYNQECGY